MSEMKIENEDSRLSQLLSELAKSSSLHGISKVAHSKQTIVKILWLLLMIGGLCVFLLQLFGLVREFNSHPTKTSVHLEYNHVQFPAITFCNMNPMKQEYIDNFTNISELNLDTQRAVYSAIFSNVPDEEFLEYNSTKDKFDDWKTRFLTEFGKLTDRERLKAGHQKSDFIHSATFSGYQLPKQKFRTIQSHIFGNCFTLDDDDVIASGNGRKNSLYIVLNLEIEEYLEQFTSSYGVRMVIHEKGTYPLPEKQGITLGYKTETHVGLRVTTMERLGGKYGRCTDGQEFRKTYKMNYTIPLCFSLCEMEQTINKCKCYLRSSVGTLKPTGERYCDFDEDQECFENVSQQILSKNIRCDCFSPCKQTVYSSTVSSSSWPHRHYLKNVLLTDICKRKPDSFKYISDHGQSVCDKIKVQFEGMTELEKDAISRNFLAVYIYFQDLTYEVISEQALYTTERFLSDIGGAMGLFVGASVLTCVEFLEVWLVVSLRSLGQKLCRND